MGLIHNWQNTVTTWIAKIGFRLETLEMIWASPLGKIVGLDDVIAFILLLFPPLQIGPSEPEGDLGRRSPHDFDKSVNLISIRGATTVHHITALLLLATPDFKQTFTTPCAFVISYMYL